MAVAWALSNMPLGPELVVCGGYAAGHGNHADCLSWTPGNDWEHFATLNIRRREHIAGVLEGKIVLIGGTSSTTGGEVLTGSAPHPTFPVEHSAFASCAIQLPDRIILAGGYSPDHGHVNSYGLEGHLAEPALPDLPQARYDSGCGSYTDYQGNTVLLVTGGQGGMSSTEYLVYPPGPSDTWQTTSALPGARTGLRVARVPDGDLLATGSGSGKSDVYRFVPNDSAAGGTWVQEISMNVGRNWHSVVGIDPATLCA